MKKINWYMTIIGILSTALIGLIPIALSQYEKGFKHGGVDKLEELIKLKDQVKNQLFVIDKREDSIETLNTFIRQNRINTSNNEDHTNLVIINESDEPIYAHYSDIAEMHGGGGAVIVPNFRTKFRVYKKSNYQIVYRSYLNNKKGDTLKISKVKIPVPFPDQYTCFCDCDLKD